MKSEIRSKETQDRLVEQELASYQTLLDKDLIALPRVLTLQREQERIKGERDALRSEIATAEAKIGETHLEISGLTDDFQEDVQSQLRDVQTKIAELSEQRVTARTEIKRSKILAPASGYILGSTTHTIGGVVPAGQPLMYVVPEDARLVAAVKVQPQDIDKLSLDQSARMRFTAFNINQTPEVSGAVIKISADALIDDVTGIPYYEAIVEIPPERTSDTEFRLMPGMPVDILVQTESRSVISYLLKPLNDSINKTFRE